MRLLYITNSFPFPLTSGHLRHFHLIRELARRHAVTLLSVVGRGFAEEHRAAVAPYTERILTFPSSSQGLPRRQKARNQLRALVRRQPVELAAVRMADTIREIRAGETFDAAIFSGRRTFPSLPALKGIPVVADLCDADSVRLRGALRYAGAARLPVILAEYARVRRAERALLQATDHQLFAACRDRDALVGSAAARATVVPNGVDLDFWSRARATRGTRTIVFTGAMRYPPNADAALFLIRRVLPLVHREVPDARLLLVGRDPPARLRRAGERAGVTVTGFVDDVRPFLEEATIFAAPLRFGAGIQNKVLEALAMKVPVVASPLAAEGLRTEDGQEPPLEVARTAPDFARRILECLAASERDPSPHHAGRRFVERNFTWSRAGDKLAGVLEVLVGGAGESRIGPTARQRPLTSDGD